MRIDFNNEYPQELGNYRQVYRRLADKTLKHLNILDHYVLEVDLVDNDRIHEINRDYRAIDRETDVISFAFNDEVEGEVKIKTGDLPMLLGNIIISVDRARSQALEYGHSFHREMKFLFLHGLLHLLGYDHQTKEDEKEMFDLQDEILGKRIIKND
ncbi:MAG TPA: rRNA maturation RNase YbeY [Bacilli bacterium]|nr:rRNA maturation RNase YbeY [Bacilli bacterium]